MHNTVDGYLAHLKQRLIESEKVTDARALTTKNDFSLISVLWSHFSVGVPA